MSTKTAKPTKPAKPATKPAAHKKKPGTGYKPTPPNGTPPPEPIPPVPGPKTTGPAVVPVGQRVRIRCYKFSITNNDPTRTTVEVNIPFQDKTVVPIVPTGPAGWVVVGSGAGVNFRTPAPGVGGQGVRPAGIAPGASLGGFRFYLPNKGRELSEPVTFGFSDRSTDTLAGVSQGGNPVTPQPDGSFRVKATKRAYCRDLDLCAPKDAEVFAAIFKRIDNGNRTDFVGVEPPPGWISHPVAPEVITIFPPGGSAPIPAGGVLRTTVYYEAINARFQWMLLDENSVPLPGATGKVSLL